MAGDYLVMSSKEIERLKVLERLHQGELKQYQAAARLGLSSRQVRRLQRKYEREGPQGLISGHRGKASNHQLRPGLKELALELVTTHYPDFGPTLAAEYLYERHDIKLGIETLRSLMMDAGLWRAKQKKKKRIHQQRLRRPQFGELIQLDGSYHDWFEGRSPKCCLLVLVDDATSSIVGALFCEAETTLNYFKALSTYFRTYGLPMALYSDKHGIFRVNIKDPKNSSGLTQFGRAMEELGIEFINAHTPQAKGRVERANSTLQDRLIKAMRIDGVNTIEEGNAYLLRFIDDYNSKFAKSPQCDANAHCELGLDKCALDHILSVQTKRSLTSNLECSYNNLIYQIQAQDRKYRLQRKDVIISEGYDGTLNIYYKNHCLNYKVIDKQQKCIATHDDKTLNPVIDKMKMKPKKVYRPPHNTPWRKFVINPRKAHLHKSRKKVVSA